jgi:hypothetical protein
MSKGDLGVFSALWLLMCALVLQQDSLDIIQHKLGVEEAGTVDIPHLVLAVEQKYLQNVAKYPTPAPVLVPQLRYGLVKVGQNGL